MIEILFLKIRVNNKGHWNISYKYLLALVAENIFYKQHCITANSNNMIKLNNCTKWTNGCQT